MSQSRIHRAADRFSFGAAHLLLYVGCQIRRKVGENRATMRETGVYKKHNVEHIQLLVFE